MNKNFSVFRSTLFSLVLLINLTLFGDFLGCMSYQAAITQYSIYKSVLDYFGLTVTLSKKVK